MPRDQLVYLSREGRVNIPRGYLEVLGLGNGEKRLMSIQLDEASRTIVLAPVKVVRDDGAPLVAPALENELAP